MLMPPLDTYPLGSVVAGGTVTPFRAGWDEQRQFTVTVPQIGTATCEVMMRNMAGSAGLVTFHAGMYGNSWYSSYGQQNSMMVNLAQAGYRLAQINWTSEHGWVNAPDGVRAGMARMAGRPATMYRYLHETYGGGQKIISVGHSGGAATIAYSLAWYRLHTIMRRAVMVAGPVMTDLWKSCAGAPGNEDHRLQWSEQQQGGTATLPDLADGYPAAGTSPCAIGGTNNANAEQWRRSGLFTAPHRRFPFTDVRFQRHLDDHTQVVYDAEDMHEWLTIAAGGTPPFTYVEVAGTSHNPDTTAAADATYAAVTAPF